MDKKVSVIIPVYKVEKYLSDCVNSVLGQSYTNLEIILVDDGSPDNCPALCEEFAKKDNRIIVLHKKNGGLSSARNYALNIISGDYFTFIDSDDLVHEDYIKTLVENLEENDVSVAICSYVTFSDELPKIIFGKRETLTNKDAFSKMIKGSTALTTAWGKLYKTEIFSSLKFLEGKNNEDEFYINHVYEKATTVSFNESTLYYYRINSNGIIQSKFTPSKLACLEAYEYRDEFIKKMGWTEFLDQNSGNILYEIIALYFDAKKAKCKTEMKFLRKKYNLWYDKNNPCFNKKDKIKIKLFKICPWLYQVTTQSNRILKCKRK